MTNRFSRLVEEDTNETSSKNPERRDKKKLSRLLKKENKTEDDLKKIETLQTKINFYNFGTEENKKKREEEKQVKEKKQKEIEKKKEMKRLKKEDEARQQKKKEEEERQRKKKEKEERQRKWKERKKKEEEERKKKEEEEKQREWEETQREWEETQREWEERERERRKEEKKRRKNKERQNAGEESDKNKSTVRCIEKELNGLNVNIPEDIKTFINKPYNKKEYYKLSRIYHPDKKLFEEDVLKLLSQLLNNHKPSVSFVADETWQK